MKIDDAIVRLLRERRTLVEDQGRIARSNARTRIKSALRSVLFHMDKEYPLIRKERVVRVSMTPLAKERRKRAARMQRRRITTSEALILGGLGVQYTTSTLSTGMRGYEAPLWAADALRAGVSHQEIREAATSATGKARRRIVAWLKLRPAPAPPSAL